MNARNASTIAHAERQLYISPRASRGVDPVGDAIKQIDYYRIYGMDNPGEFTGNYKHGQWVRVQSEVLDPDFYRYPIFDDGEWIKGIVCSVGMQFLGIIVPRIHGPMMTHVSPDYVTPDTPMIRLGDRGELSSVDDELDLLLGPDSFLLQEPGELTGLDREIILAIRERMSKDWESNLNV